MIMSICDIHNIINLKSLLLSSKNTVYDPSNITFVEFVEDILIDILKRFYETPELPIDHIILTSPFIYIIQDIGIYNPIFSNNELAVYIQNIQPCYSTWIQYLWSTIYPTDNRRIVITPLFLDFLYCILHRI